MVCPKIDLTSTGSCAAFNLRRTSRAVTALYDAALATSGLSSIQLRIVIAVAKSEPVPVGVSAKILLTERTELTRNLALLSREGLVSVSPRSAMRRCLVSLTFKGTATLARSVRQWRKNSSAFCGLVRPAALEGNAEGLGGPCCYRCSSPFPLVA
jgi:DNA-binding MarR family transcriptional regulator